MALALFLAATVLVLVGLRAVTSGSMVQGVLLVALGVLVGPIGVGVLV